MDGMEPLGKCRGGRQRYKAHGAQCRERCECKAPNHGAPCRGPGVPRQLWVSLDEANPAAIPRPCARRSRSQRSPHGPRRGPCRCCESVETRGRQPSRPRTQCAFPGGKARSESPGARLHVRSKTGRACFRAPEDSFRWRSGRVKRKESASPLQWQRSIGASNSGRTRHPRSTRPPPEARSCADRRQPGGPRCRMRCWWPKSWRKEPR